VEGALQTNEEELENLQVWWQIFRYKIVLFTFY
jgi:hypothetical protein